eukprot:TRINITY_DN16572_c0_g1_i1.p1 TRINITY_DN16572_c0_g1~~TRINITY_DN16572_c0_g1_i1.p1  ORF type:complete len:337 (-),score=114.89 TRINITY_DN16572_c0_g1_i1:23-1033(-)
MSSDNNNGDVGAEPVITFARSSRPNRGNMRKREHDDSNESDDVKIAKVNHQSIRQKHNPLVKTSARDKNKAAMAETVEYETTHTAASAVVDKYNEDDDEELRAKEAESSASKAAAEAGGSGGDGKVYKGLSNYTKYIEKGEVPKLARSGPQKAPAHLKASIRIDYQPDICKDYKETGYCGYGDNCKFLHDRGDYKTGWQLEQEWEQQQKEKKDKEKAELEDFNSIGSDIAKEEDDLPWACTICRKEFVDPVVTRCGHYFCERCALQNNKKSKKCFNCDEPTMGIFNTAHNLRAKIKQKEERLKRKKAEEGSDDEADGEGEKRNPVSVFTSSTAADS